MIFYFKYLPIVKLLQSKSLFDIFDSEFDFSKMSVEEYARGCIDKNSECGITAKIDVPIINNIVSDDTVSPCDSVAALIATIERFILNLTYEVQRTEVLALFSFYHIVTDDFNKNIETIASDNKQYITEITKKYQLSKNADELFKNLIKIYIHEKFKSGGLVKDTIIDFLKRYRYRESIFNEFADYFLREDAKTITDDYLFNFEFYRERVFRHFFEFYIRSSTPKISMAYDILNLSDITDDKTDQEISDLDKMISATCINDLNCEHFYDENYDADPDGNKPEYDTEINHEIIINDISVKPFADFTFRLHLKKPLAHQLDDLESFKNQLTIYASFLKDCLKNNSGPRVVGKIQSPLMRQQLDYVRDKAGKIVERENISKLFQRWQRYLNVYDLRMRKLTWGMIVSKMQNKVQYDNAPKTVADARNDFKEAERLIKSASNLTFPD